MEEKDFNKFQQQRIRTLGKKFLKEETQKEIREDDIWQMIEKLNLQKTFDRNCAKEIFNHLDSEKIGEIDIDKFVELLNDKANDDSEYKTFFKGIMGELSGKVEIMIEKLHSFKEIMLKENDIDGLQDLQWIIENINNEDLYEPELTVLTKIRSESRRKSKITDIDLISHYSKFWDYNRRINDLIEVSKRSKTQTFSISHNKKYFTVTNADSKRISLDDIYDKKTLYQKKKRSVFNIQEKLINQSNSEEEIHNELKNISLEDNQRIEEILQEIDDFEFDIFDLNDHAGRLTLYYLSEQIFQRLDLFQQIVPIEQFKNYIWAIITGYNRNITYHNDIHAADVLQTAFAIFSHGELDERLNLRSIDTFSIFLAAIIHDFKHPGLNNNFQTKKLTKLAVRYNDNSVLENYHIAEAFKAANTEKNNIFQNLSPEEFRLVRKSVIDCVLYTDITHHAKNVSHLKSLLKFNDVVMGSNLNNLFAGDNISKNFENQRFILGMVLHASDISNACKPTHLQKMWVDLLMVELFNQGDIEKENNLPVSILCDREKVNINKSQIGFINFIVLPTFETLLNIVPEIEPYVIAGKTNLSRYENVIKEANNK